MQQTIYFLKENEEHVRYPNTLQQIVRYEHPNDRYHHPRYHPFSQHHQSSVKTEIEGEGHAQQQQQQHMVYQVSEAAENRVVENASGDSKTQYTNLEPMQNVNPGHSYYPNLEEYPAGASNLTYLAQGGSKPGYYTIQASSPNHILYKSKAIIFEKVSFKLNFCPSDDPTLSSAVPQKQHQYPYSNVQQLYENTTVQPSSPNQPIYTYCKTEAPYWHTNAAGLEANNVIF